MWLTQLHKEDLHVPITFDNVEMVNGLCQTASEERAGEVGCIKFECLESQEAE